MVCLNKNLITKDLLTKIILLFQITIFVSPLFPLQFFHTFLSFGHTTQKKEWIICKILYISKSYFYFSYFLFSSSFSALYYILRKMCQIAFLFINYCSRIVVIEEGAFLKFPQEKRPTFSCWSFVYVSLFKAI